MSNKIIFIIGGARSGKSSFALDEASKIKGQKAYIATAEALDNEMKERIEKHKKDRGDNWNTYEEPVKISDVLSDIKNKYSVVIIDCLTLWLSNVMLQSKQPENAINEFLQVLGSLSCSSRSVGTTRLNSLNSLPRGSSSKELCGGFNGLNLFMVSNEVGMGIVPDNELAREFRDWAGFLNQKVAETADEVYLLTAGIPLKIKSSTLHGSKIVQYC